MRRLTAWIGGVAGGIAAYRLLRRRSQVASEPLPSESDERAEELRAKLARSKLTESRGAESEVAEPVVEDTPAESRSPEDRRRQVHEEGRAALDEMNSTDAGS